LQGGSSFFPVRYGHGMSILNKRNAVVGWVAVKVGKRVVKKKASTAVPSARSGGAAAGALAAVGGALLFWRKKRSDTPE
jgi:LPXTG-motif cell wall-anchored protein